jgi:hypothetical protein
LLQWMNGNLRNFIVHTVENNINHSFMISGKIEHEETQQTNLPSGGW